MNSRPPSAPEQQDYLNSPSNLLAPPNMILPESISYSTPVSAASTPRGGSMSSAFHPLNSPTITTTTTTSLFSQAALQLSTNNSHIHTIIANTAPNNPGELLRPRTVPSNSSIAGPSILLPNTTTTDAASVTHASTPSQLTLMASTSMPISGTSTNNQVNRTAMSAAKIAAIKEKIGGQKSRTLPTRRNSKKNSTVATRLKTYMSQQRIDGVYCVVALIPDQLNELTPATPKLAMSPPPSNKSPPPPTLNKRLSAMSSGSSSDSSSSSSSSSSDDSSSDDSSDDGDENMEQANTTVPISSLLHQKKKKKKKKAAPPPKPKLPEPVIFVINRHGGIFGKNPSIGQPTDTISNLPSSLNNENDTARPPPPQPKHCIINDLFTSKKHFQVVGDTKGKFYVTDLGSLNGTFVRRNFDPILSLGANASKIYGTAAAHALQTREQSQAAQQSLRGMSPVLGASSPTQRTHAASTTTANTTNSNNLGLPSNTSSHCEEWGSGSWATNNPLPVASNVCSPQLGSQSQLQPNPLAREGSSGDNSSSASGSVSVNASGYASVGTQWLNAQSLASTSGYRLLKNSMFLLGKVELLITKIHDIDHPLPTTQANENTPEGQPHPTVTDEKTAVDNDLNQPPPLQSYHIVVTYTYKPISSEGVQGPPVTKTKQIGILGARIGCHTDNEISLPIQMDGTVDEYQSEVIFENGKFYIRDLHPTMDRGLWYRLSTKLNPPDENVSNTAPPITPTYHNIASHPPNTSCQLYNGDRIKVGMSEFSISIRSLPPPLSITSQGCAYEIGTALEGNFMIQKEMQDRLVAIGNYGGHMNQAFFGVYDGHQERTVADFAAAALHHNLLEEINEVYRRGETEFEFLHSFKMGAHLSPTKSSANSSLHSPLGSPIPIMPNTNTASLINQIHSRSRSGSEAGPRLATRSSAAGLSGQQSFGVSPAPISRTNSTTISPAHPPMNRRAGSQTRLNLGGGIGSSDDPSQFADDLSLDALSAQPSLPTTAGPTANLSVNCDGAIASPPTSITPIPTVTSSLTPGGNFSSPPNSRLTPGLNPHRKNSSTAGLSTATNAYQAALHAHVSRALEADMVACIRNAYARTAYQIKGMGDAASYGGSTAVNVLLWYHPICQETRLYASNIGDSRALLIREGGRPELLSHLHIGRDPDEQVRVKAAGGRIMQNGRLAGCLEVTRAFGDQGMISFGLISEPYIQELVLQPTDTHLLVSSDGLFDVLSYDDCARLLSTAPIDFTSQQLSFALIEAAMKRRSRDNMSVIVVKLRPQNERQTISTNSHIASPTNNPTATANDLTHHATQLESSNSHPPASTNTTTATSTFVDQLILAKPMARVPSLANLYAKPPSINNNTTTTTIGTSNATANSQPNQAP